MRGDGLDFALALTLSIIAVCVFASASAVVRFHAKARRVAPKGHGLLVWHIVAIATSVSGTWLFILLGQLDTMGLFSTPRQVRLLAYSVFGILTVVAILIIAASTRRRITQSDTNVAVDVTTQRTTTFHDD